MNPNTAPVADHRPLLLPMPETIVAGRNSALTEPFLRAYRERHPTAPALATLRPMPDILKVAPASWRLVLIPELSILPQRLIVDSKELVLGAPPDEAAKNIILKSASPAKLEEAYSLERFMESWPGSIPDLHFERVAKRAEIVLEIENNNEGPVLFRGALLGSGG
jgi:hypothetical protein